MGRDQLSRKLVVILHADVVGSTSLVQQNEILAHKRIRATFKRLSKNIADYGGSTHEVRGDALVAEFERASDAVAAALSFQDSNHEFNSALKDSLRPILRIGISLGEVIIADDTITGAGVILAQRLEQLAEPGTVVVQASVAETVPTRMPFEFEYLGAQTVKGFDHPVRAYSVSVQDGIEIPAPEAAAENQTGESGHLSPAQKISSETYQTLVGESLEMPENPSIAVLPFRNLSSDPDQDFFADGMSEDIIIALSRVPNLVVIAYNSTVIYRERSVDVRQVGQELAVRHVLEGSIRKFGDRMRVTAKLVDTLNGNSLWAEQYDRELENLFDIQDEIIRNIVTELQVKIGAGELSRLIASETDNIEAWERTMRAGVLVESHSPDDTGLAKQLIGKALELDNKYAHAWVILGWVHWQESVFKWSDDPEISMDLALEAAQRAISANSNNPSGYSLLGGIYMARGNKSQAIEMCKKAIEIAPGNSYSVAYLANVLIEFGEIGEGVQKMKRAIRLCPFPPVWYFVILGAGYHLSGNNEAAVTAFELALERNPDSYFTHLWLASALVEMERLEKAQAVSQSALKLEPGYSALNWAENFKSDSHSRLKKNLLKAGFHE